MTQKSVGLNYLIGTPDISERAVGKQLENVDM
jgi:hypothetical protein